MSNILENIIKAKITYIIIFAMVLQVSSLNWGLVTRYPGVYGLEAFHTDEPGIATIPIRMLSNSDMNPHWFTQPSGYIYAMFVPLYILNIFTTVDILDSMMIGRAISIIFSLLTLVVVYNIGKEIYNETIGIVSAFLLSITPNYYYFSMYVKQDSMTVFLVTLAIYYFIKYIKYEKMNFYYISMFIGGMATSSKYVAGVILVALVFFFAVKNANISRIGVDITKNVGLIKDILKNINKKSIFIFILGFLILTPYSIFSTWEFMRGAGGEFLHYAKGHEGIGPQPYYTHLRTLIGFDDHIPGLGTVTIFVLFGIFFYLKDFRFDEFKNNIKRYEPNIFLIFWILLVLFVFSVMVKVKMPNQMLIALPIMMIFAAYGIQKFIGADNKVKKNIKIIVVCILILLTFTNTLSIIKSRQNDTRYYAAEWLKENIKNNDNIAVTPYVYIPQQFTEVKVIPRNASSEWLEKNEFDYMIISSFWYDRYFNFKDSFPEKYTFYDRLISNKTKYYVEKKISVTETNYERTITFGTRSLLEKDYHVEGEIYILKNKNV